METVKDLLAQRNALEKKLQEALRAERDSAISQIRELMLAHGLTMADITERKATRKSTRAGTSSGKKVAPKYRHPKTGDTWSGRGLQPKWLRAELAGGKRLSDFAV